MSNAWSAGSTRQWRLVRAAVLQRDRADARRTGQPWCRLRVPGVCVQASTPMHVHHEHGKGSGCKGCKVDDPTHLISTCAPCNLHVGDPSKTGDPPCQPITRW